MVSPPGQTESAEAQGTRWEAPKDKETDLFPQHLPPKSTQLQREPSPHSIQHQAHCQTVCESSVSLHLRKKHKGEKGFPGKQFSFDACHEVVSTLESRHTCGPL